MAPRKRSGSEAGMTTRGAGASKTVKTSSSKPSSKAVPTDKPASSAAKPASSKKPASTAAKGGKRGPKAPTAKAFKSRALPLHVNITHTPPAAADDKKENVASADPGFLGAVTLLASDFATGSYGWKGSKRFAVELEDPENPDGPNEKVHVMLNINATVVGSKQAKDGDDDAEEEAAEEAEVDDA